MDEKHQQELPGTHLWGHVFSRLRPKIPFLSSQGFSGAQGFEQAHVRTGPVPVGRGLRRVGLCTTRGCVGKRAGPMHVERDEHMCGGAVWPGHLRKCMGTSRCEVSAHVRPRIEMGSSHVGRA